MLPLVPSDHIVLPDSNAGLVVPYVKEARARNPGLGYSQTRPSLPIVRVKPPIRRSPYCMDSGGGQFWTPIPRLRGSKLHAETQAIRRTGGTRSGAGCKFARARHGGSDDGARCRAWRGDRWRARCGDRRGRRCAWGRWAGRNADVERSEFDPGTIRQRLCSMHVQPRQLRASRGPNNGSTRAARVLSTALTYEATKGLVFEPSAL